MKNYAILLLTFDLFLELKTRIMRINRWTRKVVNDPCINLGKKCIPCYNKLLPKSQFCYGK